MLGLEQIYSPSQLMFPHKARTGGDKAGVVTPLFTLPVN